MKDTLNYTTCHCHHWPCAYFYLLKSLGVIVAFFISLSKNSLNIRGAEHVGFIEAPLWLQRRKGEQYQDSYDQWKGITPSFLKPPRNKSKTVFRSVCSQKVTVLKNLSFGQRPVD